MVYLVDCNTYMTRGAVAAGRQVLMLLILLRSLRDHERICRRPFVLLKGYSGRKLEIE